MGKWSNIHGTSDTLECDDEYIEEFSRTSKEKFKEHLRASYPFVPMQTSQVITPG